jgi:hypothetical protein
MAITETGSCTTITLIALKNSRLFLKMFRYGPFVYRLQFRTSSPEVFHNKRTRTELGEKWSVILACDSDFHLNRRGVLHASNLRHGTDGFSSPPKEGMPWIFSPEKSDAFGRVRTSDLGYQRPA